MGSGVSSSVLSSTAPATGIELVAVDTAITEIEPPAIVTYTVPSSPTANPFEFAPDIHSGHYPVAIGGVAAVAGFDDRHRILVGDS